MDNNNLTENSFIIDLSNARGTLRIINELSNILEISDAKDKNIYLKIREVELSQAQLLSIRALIQATGADLSVLDSDNERTIIAAEELGINVAKFNNNGDDTNKDSIDENESFEKTELNEEQNQTEEEPIGNDEQKSNEESPKVNIPEFMKFEEISQDNLEEIKKNATINDNLYPQFGTTGEKNTSDNQTEQPFYDDYNYTSEVPASELSYEIFKTEDIEEQKNEELPTLYLKQTLRSGQTLCYDGNILVIGDTHPGSELIAKGDITVWGVLGGVAHAGTSGDKNARIRALKLNAIQLRIAGIYAGRSNTENLPFIQRSTEFTPQEARLENDTIVVRSIINEI